MKHLTLAIVAIAALTLGACASKDPAPSSTYQAASTSSYSK